MTTWGGAVLSSGGVRASTDAGELRRRREPRRHAFEHGAEFGVADVAQAVSQLGGSGFQHGRRLNGRGACELAVGPPDGGAGGFAEDAGRGGDAVGRDILNARGVVAAERQEQRGAHFYSPPQ